MKSIIMLFIATLLLSGCGTTRQLMIKESPLVLSKIPSYQEEVYWVPESHKEALVNPGVKEDGSYEKAHYRKIRVKDGHWGTLDELIQRLREEYGHAVDIKKKVDVVEKPQAEKSVQKEDEWPFGK